MNSNLKKGLFLVTLFGVISISGERVRAEDVPDRTVMPGVGIEAVLNSCHMSNKEIDVERYLVPTEKGEYFAVYQEQTDKRECMAGKTVSGLCREDYRSGRRMDEGTVGYGNRLCMYEVYYNRKSGGGKGAGTDPQFADA